MSPKLSVPSELLYHERTSSVSASQRAESDQQGATAYFARGGTLHLQDHVPFKPAITRFPARKPVLAAQSTTTAQVAADDEVGASRRPITMYLADHHPYLLAPRPEAVITKPGYNNMPSRRHGRMEGAGQAASQDIEMQEIRLREPTARPVAGEDESGQDAEEEGKAKTEEDMKRRKRNCIIGSVFILTLVFAIVVFAVFMFEVNKPTGAAS